MSNLKFKWLALLGLLLCLLATYVAAEDVTVQVRENSKQSSSGLIIGKKLVVVDSYTLPTGKTLSGNMLLIANQVDLQGDVLGRLHIIAKTVKVTGHVVGHMSVVAEHIDIQPSAKINGKFNYLASSVKLDDEAQVSGHLQSWSENSRWHMMSQRFPWFLYSMLFVLGAIGLSSRRFSGRMAYNLRRRAWFSLVCGLALVFLTPWLILTAILSIVGIPLSFLLLGLYILSLSLAYVYAAWIIGGSLTGLVVKGDHAYLIRLISLAIGLSLLYFIGMLPVFGKLFKILALCIGLGGMALALISSRDTLTATTEKTI